MAAIHVLASGSKGNATLFQVGGQNILVDCGISCRRLEAGLSGAGVEPAAIDAVLVTHEHADHTSGLAQFLRRHRRPVYGREAVLAELRGQEGVAADCLNWLPDSLTVGQVKVEAFPVMHDAVDPVGFVFSHRQEKYGYLTDSGFAGPTVRRALDGCDAMVVEANHDRELLRRSGYPWPLKRRIMGNRGHMANSDCGWLLARLARRPGMAAILAHLSEENNRPDLALRTVAGILGDQGNAGPDGVDLLVAGQWHPVSWQAAGF
ncbi:MAG: MBL fold metallo-hydrolase [Negativicutes bacterium]|nr:MBL fold metallo-hydrolase [Negativicutes bacterium]